VARNVEMRKCISSSVENTEGWKPRGRHRARRKGNINMAFKLRGRNWTGFVEFYEEECSFQNCIGYYVFVKVEELSNHENH
jgi:hypothetical protein